MPRELKPYSRTTKTHSAAALPYPTASAQNMHTVASGKAASVWSAADDEILLQARASGMNWHPIARNHFPNKTANACRKRHERLMERRHVEDWDLGRLEALAREYMVLRKEIWEPLAERLGERWVVVEVKCLEMGLKNLQSTARTANRRASAESHGLPAGSGASDHNSDSGIGLGSDGEVDAGHVDKQSWTKPEPAVRSLPQPLPLYEPPPPIRRVSHMRAVSDCTSARCSFTIDSVLSPREDA
ncbi:hypothetical protein K470DRAFT_130921 [Piedraia hortae CBS 480.64]|uniref:Myb-like domain-containing protein n=1 Tax=Piedraia hortae CBS 480.64 TaxID=1314780 RepID=A0A6A7BTZ6_9PEZI|nr:hypothetical protein K470DRAFT_130921 [Piedraia hortae CBS 480.64]